MPHVQRKPHGKHQTEEEKKFVKGVIGSLDADSFDIEVELSGNNEDPHVLDKEYVSEHETGYRIDLENIERLIHDISTVNGHYSPGMGRAFIEGRLTENGEAFFAYDQMEDVNYGMSSGVLTINLRPLD